MKIKQWFIPNRKNKFHPMALRPVGLMVFMAIFIAIPLAYNITSVRQFKVLGYATNITIGDLYSLSNQERTNNGLSPLNLDSTLNNAAIAKANDMMADDYWAHVAPDGTTPWDFISGAGYKYVAAGENLAKGFSLSDGVVAGWMASPLHRDNVLNSSYKDVGYAVVNGLLQGEQTTLVVAMYGAREEPIVAATTSIQTNNEQQSDSTPIPSGADQPVKETVATEPTATAEKKTISDQSKNQSVKEQTTVPSNLSNSGSVAGAAVSLPVKTYNSLNWGQKASITLISTLMLLFIMKHTMIWREQKRGLKHIWLRAHPLGQLAILTVVLVVILFSGVGVIL
jgi:hypothetical protein